MAVPVSQFMPHLILFLSMKYYFSPICCSTKLKTEELREAHQMVTEAQWADDKLVTHCAQCKKAFSVSRRKVGHLLIQCKSLAFVFDVKLCVRSISFDFACVVS